MNRFSFTAKAKSKYFALPGAKAWELWAMQEGQIVFVREALELTGLDEPDLWLLGLPIHQVFAVPMWVHATDAALLPEMIHLQLERRGVLPRSRENVVMQYDLIAQNENRKLFLVTVLPERMPEGLQLAGAAQYEVSARFRSLPANEVVVFRELNRIAVAVTRDAALCYFQGIAQPELNSAAVHEVLCLRLQLEAHQIIRRLDGVTLWGDFLPDQAAALGTALQLPVRIEAQPSPRLPDSQCGLMPNPVRQTRSGLAGKTRKRQLVLSMAGLYVLFLLGWMGLVGWDQLQKIRLESELQSGAATVADLSRTAARWRDLQPAIDPDYYPVELLYRSTRALPAEGVRLTLFEQRANKILITGEAKNARAAFKFKEDLEKTKELAASHWQMPQPQPLPNDSAKFQIEGNTSNASAQ